MNKLLLLVVLLTFTLPPVSIHSQETDAAASARQEEPAKPPARRPKMPKVITFESSVGNVSFPHKVHQKMGCQKCHHQIHAKDLVTPHDEYLTYSWVSCRDCHDESQNHSIYYGCAKCHHSNLENIADETLSAKVVVHKSCWNCHLSGTGVEASERCSFCHEKEQTPLQTSQGSSSPGEDAGLAGGSADAEAK